MYGGRPVFNQFELMSLTEITISNNGYIFVADSHNHCVHVFSAEPEYTLITTIGTPGRHGVGKYEFNNPIGLLIDNDILYVSDSNNHRIQVFRLTIDAILHICGPNNSKNSILLSIYNNPCGLAIENDILYEVDKFNNCIMVFSIIINVEDNTILAIFKKRIGSGVAGNNNYLFYKPSMVAILDNILYVSDTYNHRIQVFRITINADNTITVLHISNPNGSPHSIGTGILGNTANAFSYPKGITLHNNILYVVDKNNHRIQMFHITINANNTITALHLPGTNGSPHSIGTGIVGDTDYAFHFPEKVVIHNELLFLADSYNNRIQIYNGDIANPSTLQYYDTVPTPQPKYTILTQNHMIPLNIRNTPCILCNLQISTPNPQNRYNNVNGYVVRLHTYNPMYFHYTCIYNYIISHSPIDIKTFGINRHDTLRLIDDSHNNNNIEGADFFIPDFIMLNRETDVPVNSRVTPCRLCGFQLCTRIIDTTNNLNGYVVHLHNLTQPNTFYYHYKCIYKYFIQRMLLDNPYKSPYYESVLDRDDINMLLNIDGKADAVIGNGFYIYF